MFPSEARKHIQRLRGLYYHDWPLHLSQASNGPVGACMLRKTDNGACSITNSSCYEFASFVPLDLVHQFRHTTMI